MFEKRKLKRLLTFKFEMEDLGIAKRILGMEIDRNLGEGSLLLYQQTYLHKVLMKYGMENCKPISVPKGTQFKLSNMLYPKCK